MRVNSRLKIETDIFKTRSTSRTMFDDSVPYYNQRSDNTLGQFLQILSILCGALQLFLVWRQRKKNEDIPR